MIKKRNLKGLSDVIAVLLIVLLAILLVGILWIVVKDMTKQQSEFVGVQKQFFKENVDIYSTQINGGSISLSLRKTTGEIRVKTNESREDTLEMAEMDIISIVDVSGSMCSCNGVSPTCCSNTLRGQYSGGICTGVNSNRGTSCVSTCGGEWVDRLSYAKEANKELINILSRSEGTRIGLVAYSSSVDTSASIDLTNNVTLLINIIDSWQAGGSTCICCAINDAARRLRAQSSDDRIKKVIVMSDGEANVECSTQHTHNAMQDAIRAACDSRASLNNLVINSIGAGENVNEPTLVNISICGGGKYFSALDINDLIEIYRVVAQDIKTTYKSINSFDYLFIVFSNENASYTEKVIDLPDPLVIKGYQFNLTGKLEGNVTKIEIYPVIIADSGREIIGPLFDVWKASP